MSLKLNSFNSLRRTKAIDFLNQPLSTLWCALGWILATSVFVLLTRVAGGVTTSDAFVTANSTLAIAHGELSCAYPPQITIGDNPLAPPFYPLVSGGLSALFRIGHALPFPSAAQLGTNCSHAVAAIGSWMVPTGALFSIVILGYVGWLFLAVGVTTLLRASGLGRRNWELFGLLAVACSPPAIMCLNEYFHPQDMIAAGLALCATAAFLRKWWFIAGVLLGLAFTSQQFAILFFVPLILVSPRSRALRLTFGSLSAVAVLDGPWLLITSGRAAKAIFFGTGLNTKRATLLALTNVSGNSLFLLSRTFPIVVAAALALWARRRSGASTMDSVSLIALLATSLCLRLVFEVNLWGYYFMTVTVLLIMLQIIQSRINWWFVLWLSLVTFAAIDGGLANRPALAALPVSLWQMLLVPWALAMAFTPLHRKLRFQGTIQGL